MATIDLNILNAAFEDGLFKRRLSDRQRLYFKPSIVTAHEVIQQIDDREHNGINVEALATALGMSPNTIKIYCRWLSANKLIEAVETDDPGQPLVYYTVKSRFVRPKK